MKVCGHCRNEVDSNAIKCPYCLENPNDGASYFWGWLVLAAGAFVLFRVFFG